MDSRGRTSATLASDNERSIQDVLKDIGSNIQDIVHSEIKLVKIEVGDTARRARSSSIALASGGVLGIYAIGFLLLAAMFALEIVVPSWLAALIMGVLLLTVARNPWTMLGVALGGGLLLSMLLPKSR